MGDIVGNITIGHEAQLSNSDGHRLIFARFALAPAGPLCYFIQPLVLPVTTLCSR